MAESVEVTVTPAVNEQPAPEVADQKVVAPASDEPAADAKPTEPDHVKETKQALKGVQKRIDELTRARYEAEERGRQEVEHWRAQAEAAAEQLRQMQAAKSKPDVGQFSDYGDYVAALARYEATQVTDQRIQQERMAAWQQQQQYAEQQKAYQAQQAYQANIAEKLEAATKKFPDFVQVISSPELPGLHGTPALQAILESEHGAEIMYYLGKNAARAHQVAALSPINQVREIGRIEALVSTGRTVTGAPPPPSQIGGGSGAAPNPARMSDEEWIRWREDDLAKRRKR